MNMKIFVDTGPLYSFSLFLKLDLIIMYISSSSGLLEHSFFLKIYCGIHVIIYISNSLLFYFLWPLEIIYEDCLGSVVFMNFGIMRPVALLAWCLVPNCSYIFCSFHIAFLI